jgi:hypothetical protein
VGIIFFYMPLVHLDILGKKQSLKF